MAGLVVLVVALWAAFEYSHAAPAAAEGPNIGVVSIRTVISESQHQARYRSTIMSTQSKLQAQLQSRAKDIEAAEAELNTMRPGTESYLKQLEVVIQKRSDLQGQQEYLSEKRNLEDKEWMEKLYQATLKIISDLAQEKGLDLVLERTDPQFPVPTREELLATFSTHKVLYAGNCTDLTREVITRLDALDSLAP